ncbi:hypothetical protein KR009_002630, partial [Drosophila setifemur]
NKFNWHLHLYNNKNLVELREVSRLSGPDVADEHPPELLQFESATETKQKQEATSPGYIIDMVDNGVIGRISAGEGGGERGVARVGGFVAAVLATEDVDKATADFCDMDMGVAGLELAAAALSPTETVGGEGLSSSRTSINNSTENLSYVSDNFYGDDLILLDDVDVEAEEVSLNSDDCVYAYRGDGTDFVLAMDVNPMDRGTRLFLDSRHVSGNAGEGVCGLPCGDDETEFLEMDFEPDPPSELDFAGGTQDLGTLPQANLLLMQRDFSQMSGMGEVTPTHGRQFLKSPIEDLPKKYALKQQQQLSVKFARISLNLDQIKDGGTKEGVEPTLISQSVEAAHSLPSVLYTSANLCRSTSVLSNHTETKLTGAKPKQLSYSSYVMSKSRSSSKSRRSQPSTSCDERCFSCTDFRATYVYDQHQQAGESDQVAPMLVAPAAEEASTSSSHSYFAQSSNDENCLDCLEKEFLANTIGKALDMSTCSKCRRRSAGRGSNLSLYTRAEQTRCRRGLPGHFDESGGLFAGWHSSSATGTASGHSFISAYQKRFHCCDYNYGGVQLLKKCFPTEPLFACLSTGETCDEEHLLQTLDKLNVTYDQAQIHTYFEHLIARKPCTNSLNLKQLLLQASKRQGNHRKLKRLIELVTKHRLIVQFKRVCKFKNFHFSNEGIFEFIYSQTNEGQSALVPVRVAEVLKAWGRHRDLSILRHMDERFHHANVMGKVGHILRQATAAASTSAQAASSYSSARRALPEVLMIPQYYEMGVLTLTRQC